MMDQETNNNTSIDFQITRYLAGDASPREIEDLLHWIEQSDDNRRYFLRQQDIWSALNPHFDIRDIDISKSERRLLTITGIKHHGLGYMLRKIIRACTRIAAAAFLPVLALALYFMFRTPAYTGQEITMTTSSGCTGRATLPDGTGVWLNANSTFRYPPEFKGDTRDVFLEGEAYFDVSTDKSRPFNVATPYLSVTATGTQFNVNAYDAAASVTLIEGKVDVDGTDLRPGEHLMLDDGKAVVSKNGNPDKYCSWRDGILIFEDERLTDICTRLHQIYGVDFDISPELHNRTFRMILSGENISEILHYFEMSAPVICESENLTSPDNTSKTKLKIRIRPS